MCTRAYTVFFNSAHIIAKMATRQLLHTRMVNLGPSGHQLCRMRLPRWTGECWQLVRFRSTKHATNYFKSTSKVSPVEMALSHFDGFYSKVYQKQWQSIRLGLLSANKYCALINHFGNTEDIEISFRQNGAYDIQYIYEKNLRRVLRYIEKKTFIENRRAAIKEGIIEADEPFVIPNSNVTSDSEFEEIGAFFTGSEGDTGGTFMNAAQMDVNLNDFVPVSDLKYKEEIVDDRGYYDFYDIESEVPITRIQQDVLNYPTNLNLFTYPRNDFSTFASPKISDSNLLNYYLIDAASALPVFILDIQDGDYVADFCAAPGGKSLMLFLTLKNCSFFFNDLSLSRFHRLKNVFNSFVPVSSQKKIEFSNQNATKLNKSNTFDKILVDAPCTNDRHSLYVNDNNIFAPKRIEERVAIPSRQLEILLSALDSVKVGGTVVYSTCSLSPIQNDGVVHMALKHIWQNTNRSYSVVNLKEALRPLRGIFRFNHNFKYGTQVVPHLCSNFGPMYFCKLVRTS